VTTLLEGLDQVESPLGKDAGEDRKVTWFHSFGDRVGRTDQAVQSHIMATINAVSGASPVTIPCGPQAL
jgi:hypothetical protein